MRRWLVLPVLLVALTPVAHAQTLEQEFSEFHFERVILTVTWVKTDETNAAHVLATAENLNIEGESASDLRHCIDGQECPMSQLSMAAAGANRDGSVSADEVENFADTVQLGMSTRPEVRNFLNNMRGIIRIDDKNATTIALTDLRIADATGDVDSTDRIRLSVSAAAAYRTVVPAESHAVWMQRSATNFNIADRVEVRTGSGWRIQGDSVQPAAMTQFLDGGKFEGSQEEFESSEPLTFTMQEHESNAGTVFLWGALGLAAVAGGIGGFLWWRR